MKFEEACALISSDETSWSIQCLLSSLLFLHLVHLSLFNNPPNYTIKALRNNCPFWIIYQNVDQSSAWCLFHVKLLFSLDLGGLHICQRRLSQKIRPFLFTHSHSHMDVLNHTAVVVGRKYAASFGGYNVGKERKQQKIVALLLGSSSRHKKWAIDLSYFDKTKHLFLHLPPLLVVVYFFKPVYFLA